MSYKFKRSCQWAVIKLVDFNLSCLLSNLKDGWQKISAMHLIDPDRFVCLDCH